MKQNSLAIGDITSSDGHMRWRHAASALNSVRSMRAILHYIQRMEDSERPAMRVIAGKETLRNARRMAVFSGSFNPLTTAHTGLVESALAAGYDTALWLMPVTAVNKEAVERAALPDRVAQMRAYVMTAANQGLALTNRGLYYEQARLLRRRFPHTEVSILVGFDKVMQIFDARYYQDRDAALDILFAHAQLLVAPRAGAGRDELAALLARPENARYAAHVAFLETPAELADESSTQARSLAAEAGNADALRYLIPPEAMALVETGAYDIPTGRDHQEDRYQRRLYWLQGLTAS